MADWEPSFFVIPYRGAPCGSQAPTLQGSLQTDGVHQYHTKECRVRIQGSGRAVCIQVPQTLATGHHIILPLADNTLVYIRVGDSLDQILDLSTQSGGQVGTLSRMIGHTSQFGGQVSLYQLPLPPPGYNGTSSLFWVSTGAPERRGRGRLSTANN